MGSRCGCAKTIRSRPVNPSQVQLQCRADRVRAQYMATRSAIHARSNGSLRDVAIPHDKTRIVYLMIRPVRTTSSCPPGSYKPVTLDDIAKLRFLLQLGSHPLVARGRRQSLVVESGGRGLRSRRQGNIHQMIVGGRWFAHRFSPNRAK
jgi:hypothetical protein